MDPGSSGLASLHEAAAGLNESSAGLFAASGKREWAATARDRARMERERVQTVRLRRERNAARSARLVDDFLIRHSERTIHVQNAPSPAAPSSLMIASMIADQAGSLFDLDA